MPSKIQHKRSSVPGKVPTTAQLDLAELAVNTRDGKLYLKRDNGNGTFTILEVGAVVSVAGKTGAVTLAKGDVGLGNVDNTADAQKPVSGPQATALAAKADISAVNTALAGKAAKADISAVNTALAGKADISAVNTALAGKADISAVNTALAGKVDTTRQVAAGTGLTGGGALDADRTLAADIATKAEAQAGAAAGKLASALSMEQHMLANELGWGQTWQAPEREASTAYKNTTGRPIMVALAISSQTARYVQVSADGVNWLNVGYTLALFAAAQFIVPNGWFYRINGPGTVGFWAELR